MCVCVFVCVCVYIRQISSAHWTGATGGRERDRACLHAANYYCSNISAFYFPSYPLDWGFNRLLPTQIKPKSLLDSRLLSMDVTWHVFHAIVSRLFALFFVAYFSSSLSFFFF